MKTTNAKDFVAGTRVKVSEKASFEEPSYRGLAGTVVESQAVGHQHFVCVLLDDRTHPVWTMTHRPGVALLHPESLVPADDGMKSWRVMVRTVSCKPGTWTGNGMRYATKRAAKDAAADLSWRWTAVEDYKVEPSPDEPNA